MNYHAHALCAGDRYLYRHQSDPVRVERRKRKTSAAQTIHEIVSCHLNSIQDQVTRSMPSTAQDSYSSHKDQRSRAVKNQPKSAEDTTRPFSFLVRAGALRSLTAVGSWWCCRLRWEVWVGQKGQDDREALVLILVRFLGGRVLVFA